MFGRVHWIIADGLKADQVPERQFVLPLTGRNMAFHTSKLKARKPRKGRKSAVSSPFNPALYLEIRSQGPVDLLAQEKDRHL